MIYFRDNTAPGGFYFKSNVQPLSTDTTPDVFSFNDLTGEAVGAVSISNLVTITGIDSPADISIVGGDFSINGGSFTSSSTTISNNQTVRVRVTNSSLFSTQVSTTLTVGGVSDTWNVTTASSDETPDPFVFNDVVNAMPNTQVTSNTLTITGMNNTGSISIVGGEYSVNGDTFTASEGTIENGQTVQVRANSSTSYLTTTSAVLTIGGTVSDSFDITTSVAPDITPNPFSIVPVGDFTSVDIGTVLDSDPVIPTGFDSPAPISITGGTFSVNGGPFTSEQSTFNVGQSLVVRMTMGNNYSTSQTVVVDIGGQTSSRTATTISEDTIPDPFNIEDLVNSPLNTVVYSTPVVITGLRGFSPISITTGEYRIGPSGPWVSDVGQISNGQSLYVRATTSSENSSPVSTTINIGGVEDVWTVTTVTLGIPASYKINQVLHIHGDWHNRTMAEKANELIDNLDSVLGNQGINKISSEGDFILENVIGTLNDLATVLGEDLGSLYGRISDHHYIGATRIINRLINKANDTVFV